MYFEAISVSVLEETKTKMSYVLEWWRTMQRAQKELNKGIKARQEGRAEKRENAVLANPEFTGRRHTVWRRDRPRQGVKGKRASSCRSSKMTRGGMMAVLTRGLTWGPSWVYWPALCPLGSGPGEPSKRTDLEKIASDLNRVRKNWWLFICACYVFSCVKEMHTGACVLSRVWLGWPDRDAQQGKC